MQKNTSVAFLKVAVAAFCTAAPILIGILGINQATYLMLAVFTAMLSMRIMVSGRICISSPQIMLGGLIVFTLIMSPFTRSGINGVLYITQLCLAWAFMAVIGDYFSENSSEGLKGRLMYMVLISGLVCSFANIIYWLFVLVPVGSKAPLSFIAGQNSLLSIYMVCSVFCAVNLIYKNTKRKKKLLSLAILPLLFVLVMAKSFIGYVVLAVLLVSFFVKLRIGKHYVPIMSIMLLAVTIIAFVCFKSTTQLDAILSGLNSIIGIGGGGFLSGQEIFQSSYYPYSDKLALLAIIVSSSGLAGLLFSVLLIARCVYMFVKNKSQLSFFTLLFVIILMLVPITKGLLVVLLSCGLITYSEYVNSAFSKTINKNKLQRFAVFFAVVVVVAIYLFVHSVISNHADIKFKNSDYEGASALYANAAAINPTDDISCIKASVSIRKSNRDYKNALEYVQKAEKRNKKSLESTKEKAYVYNYAGDLRESVIQWKQVCVKAPFNDTYKVKLAQSLYKIIKNAQKGSSETKEAYKELVHIAEETFDLDCKKQINDIADKAQKYNKGELLNE